MLSNIQYTNIHNKHCSIIFSIYNKTRMTTSISTAEHQRTWNGQTEKVS